MRISIDEILSFLGCLRLNISYSGDMNCEITGFSALSNINNDSIIWINNLDFYDIDSIDENLNLLIITNKEYSGKKRYNVISCDNSKAAFFSILDQYFATPLQTGISNTSTILTKKIGNDVSVGHNCFIDKDVTIGDSTIIRNNVVIEGKANIGNDCVIESGAVIGSMGFGYYKTEDNIPKKVPDFGGVIIGDRVEIGANCCIVRGTLLDTIVGNDTKIDNLCHIAHNVKIGERCLITASAEISGSVTISDDVYIAPNVSIVNQLQIGENSYIGIGSVVIKDVEANKLVAGVPAKFLRDNK